ncbi:hypothetical protein AB0J74_22015 [Asanoa sp. NPDC049573]|uniref:hypothetical protein n=1 Tax=Asanoa sp. NPDC049573 TaxID=3155396 RepID=UPI00341C2962
MPATCQIRALASKRTPNASRASTLRSDHSAADLAEASGAQAIARQVAEAGAIL